jgi:hypothetical protein
MTGVAVKLLTLTFCLSLAAISRPMPALAAGGGGGGGGDPMSSNPYAEPAPSAAKSTTAHRAKKTKKHSLLDDSAFVQGYRAAYSTIYDHHDYAAAIDQLESLGHDDYAYVANLIGIPIASSATTSCRKSGMSAR